MKKPTQKKKKKGSRKKANSQSKQTKQTLSPIPSSKPNGKKDQLIKNDHAPVPKKDLGKKSKEEGALKKYAKIVGQFLREAKTELKKVKWPTRKELLASTAIVIVLVLIVALYLGIIDFGLIKVIKFIVG